MKKYDLIVGMGCSFMEGGGLDDREIYSYINKLNKPITISELDIARNFKSKNNFIAYLAELYNCKYINFAESKAPNEYIFLKVFEYFEKTNNDKKILFVGQLSLFNRIYVYYENTKQYYKLKDLEFELPPYNNEEKYEKLKEFYTNFLSYIYNEDLEYRKAYRNVETTSDWLKNKGIDCVWMAFDGTPDKFVESKHFIKFDGDNLGAYITKNGLRLCDIPQLKTGDRHISIEGHKILAERLYKHIETNYND